MLSFGEIFGKLIRERRGIEGLTQQQLAVSAFGDERKKTRISELESGKVKKPHRKTEDLLCSYFLITKDELNAYVERHSQSDENVISVEFGVKPAPYDFLKAPITLGDLPKAFSGKILQVALDTIDLKLALRIAKYVNDNSSGILEVGDPLIKKYGMGVIEQIKSIAPETPIVAEFASSDWIDDEIELAAKSGADFVQVIGLATEARIRRAVRTARKFKIGFTCAVLMHEDINAIGLIAEQNGADMLAVIRNIDTAKMSSDSTDLFSMLDSNFALPTLISGGFTSTNLKYALKYEWNIVIVGSHLIYSNNPTEEIESINALLKGQDDE